MTGNSSSGGRSTSSIRARLLSCRRWIIASARGRPRIAALTTFAAPHSNSRSGSQQQQLQQQQEASEASGGGGLPHWQQVRAHLRCGVEDGGERGPLQGSSLLGSMTESGLVKQNGILLVLQIRFVFVRQRTLLLYQLACSILQQANESPFERLVRHSIDNGDAARATELHRAQLLSGMSALAHPPYASAAYRPHAAYVLWAWTSHISVCIGLSLLAGPASCVASSCLFLHELWFMLADVGWTGRLGTRTCLDHVSMKQQLRRHVS